jgi:hypothetical protein
MTRSYFPLLLSALAMVVVGLAFASNNLIIDATKQLNEQIPVDQDQVEKFSSLMRLSAATCNSKFI